METVIVVGAQNVGFSLIRSLKDKGLRLVVLVTDPHDFAHHSRFVEEWHRVPSPASANDAFIQWLLEAASRWEHALLIPSSDAALTALCQSRDQVLQHYHAALPTPTQLKTLLHKGSLYRLAAELGIRIPGFFQPSTSEELRELRSQLHFPCLLKPCESNLFFAQFRRKLFRVDTFEELEKRWRAMQDCGLETMICELIPGADDHLFFYACYRTGTGRVAGEICVQKLRQHPPGFGVGRVARTVGMIDLLKTHTQTLLEHCRYAGFASAEFKKDERDSTYKLMEVNLRPVLQESLFTAAGVNFPWLIDQALVHKAQTPPPPYQAGLYWHYLAADLVDTLRYGGRREHWHWRDYLAPYRQPSVPLIPFFEDPRLFVIKTGSSFVKILTNLHQIIRTHLI